MNETYQRTPQDIADEYDSAQRTIAARKRRCPATAEGLDYAQRMDAIAAGLAICVTETGVLVATREELQAAEQALIDARAELAASLDEFKAIDTARQQTAPPAPQVATVAAVSRAPIASAPTTG